MRLGLFAFAACQHLTSFAVAANSTLYTHRWTNVHNIDEDVYAMFDAILYEHRLLQVCSSVFAFIANVLFAVCMSSA